MFEHVDPAELGAPRGWTNGMLAAPGARILFVAGQDAATVEGAVETDDFVEQFDVALAKTLAVVREAGGTPESIGRMTVFVTDLDASLAEVPDRGGSVIRGATTMGAAGRYAVVQDPAGAVAALFEPGGDA